MCHCYYHIKKCLFVLLIILSSCNRDNITENTIFEEGVPVPLQIGNISSFNNVSVRSTTELSEGDIGISLLESTGYEETRSNVQYTNSGDGWDVASDTEPIYVTKNEANLCAYYPYSSDETLTNNSLTLTSQLYTSSADFCYQTGVTATSETPVSFTMNHAYAKLKFNLTHDDDYDGNCAISKISIANDGILSSNTLDISTGTYGTGTAGTVTVEPDISSISSGSTETIYVLMVPTVTDLSGDITLTLTIDNKKISTTTSNITSLTAGNEYTINITLKSDDIPEVKETANCYIIAPDNSLKIPVNIRGNGVEVAGTGISTTISPSSVGILWQTSPDLISLSDMTSDEKITITANSTTGNAVIAAYDENEDILWSWHIWITDYDPDNGTTYTITNSSGESYTFMDRNLGATTATAGQVSTLGLIYQWGRKDPFPGSASTTANTEPTIYDASGTGSTDMITKTAVSVTSNLPNAIKNPITFYYGTSANTYDWYSVTESTHNDELWGGAYISSPTVKTMFDPSPAGWRVPTWKSSVSPWSEFSTDNFTWSSTHYGCTYSNEPFYPAAGYRDLNSGALSFVGSHGDYWSGSPNSIYGYGLFFLSNLVDPANDDNRAYGFSVRCVKDE